MKTNLMIIGSGGREHALAWKLAQSPRAGKIFVAPGNSGTAGIGTNLPIQPSDKAALVEFAKANSIGLAVIGPDDALADGLADAFEAAGIPAFGPTAEAARLESSKIFAKEFCRRHGIPTAAGREFSDSLDAHLYCRSCDYPIVIKADGLALGKGVVIARNPSQAALAIHRAMDSRAFGKAGSRLVIEEFLSGPECSIHALVDRSGTRLFPDCRDHKQAFDGGVGPNTGGMGTISPSGSIDEPLLERIRSEILERFVEGIRADGIDFRGMLFPGLILAADGPRVLEFNCRWGDPETQVLVRRLESDLLDLLEGVCANRIAESNPAWSPQSAACVVLASGGYPGPYPKDLPIEGIARAEEQDGVVVFHAGAAIAGDRVVTSGGRVLGITALGATLSDAVDAAYRAADQIHFDNLHRRNDIGRTQS